MVPDRRAPEFAAAENATVPLPLPEAPEVIVIHCGVVGTAVHAHPLGAVTVNVPVPPAAGTVAPSGFSLYVQVGRGAAWLTVKFWPPMEMVLERAEPMFGSTT
jgi:hypothetical protein